MLSYEFSLENNDTRLLVKINKTRFEAACVNEFKQGIKSYWQNCVQEVIIDVHAVDFIDSSGIWALLSVQKKFRDRENPVELINAKPNVINVIELLRLHRVFKINSETSLG